jgi:hypothetical protein
MGVTGLDLAHALVKFQIFPLHGLGLLLYGCKMRLMAGKFGLLFLLEPFRVLVVGNVCIGGIGRSPLDRQGVFASMPRICADLRGYLGCGIGSHMAFRKAGAYPSLPLD